MGSEGSNICCMGSRETWKEMHMKRLAQSAEQRRCSINDIFYNLFAKWYQEIWWNFQVNVLPTILLHFLSWRVLIFLHTAWKIFKYYYRSSHYSMSMWLSQVVAEKCFKDVYPKCCLLRLAANKAMAMPFNQMNNIIAFSWLVRLVNGKNFMQNNGNTVDGKSPFTPFQRAHNSSPSKTKIKVSRLLACDMDAMMKQGS